MGRENSRQRRLIGEQIDELEHIPSPISWVDFLQVDVKPIQKLRLMVLSVARADGYPQLGLQIMGVDGICRFAQVVGNNIHELLYEVALRHKQILANGSIVAF